MIIARIAFSLFLFCILSCSPVLAFDGTKDLFVKGDLSEEWEAKLLSDPPKIYKSVLPTTRQSHILLSRAGKLKGGASVFQYDNAEDAGSVYENISQNIHTCRKIVKNLGDQASSSFEIIFKEPYFQSAIVVFLRGTTVISLHLSNVKEEELIPYAKKIDARLRNSTRVVSPKREKPQDSRFVGIPAMKKLMKQE